jgi:nucleoside-diphosphate-sugar epimerase
MAIKKILILGSTGFIGRNIKNILSDKKDYEVYASTKKEVDILEKQQLSNYFETIQPDIVINCSGNVGSSLLNHDLDDYEILTKNLIMMINILDCCKKYAVKNIFFFSTYRIFGDNIHEKYNESNIHLHYDLSYNSGYLLSKKMLHLHLDLFYQNNPDIKYICLILTNIYGEHDSFIENGRIVAALIKKISEAKKKNEDLVIHSNSNNQVNLVYVKDIVNIIENCINDNNKDNNLIIEKNMIVFNENGTLSLQNLVNLLTDLMDYKKQVIFINTEEANTTFKNNNIMKPDLAKFKKFFNNTIEFSDIRNTLKETIDYFYRMETGIS